jgi:hypothetical protein
MSGVAQAPAVASASRRRDRICIGAIFFYALFFPSFHSVFGTTGAILVNGGILGLAASYFLLLQRGVVRFQSGSEREAVIAVLAILLYYLAAIAFAAAFLSEQVIFRDIYEVHRPALHMLVFLLPLFLIRQLDDLRTVERWLGVAFVIIVLIGLNQYTRTFDLISELYTKPANVTSRRVSAPFGNPYDYAFVMTFFCLFFLFKLLWTRRFVYAVLCFVSIAGVLLTQSRAVFGALVVALAVIAPSVLIFEARHRLTVLRVPKRIVLFSAVVLALAGGGTYVYSEYSDHLTYLITGIERVAQGQEMRSLSVRQQQFAVTLARADENVLVALFGNGPSKGVMEYVESVYAYYLFRYGFLGLLLVFATPLLLSIVLLGRTINRKVPHKALLLAVLCWFLVIPVASIGNNFTEQFRISFLYYFFLGMSVRVFFLSRGAVGGTARDSVGPSIGVPRVPAGSGS